MDLISIDCITTFSYLQIKGYFRMLLTHMLYTNSLSNPLCLSQICDMLCNQRCYRYSRGKYPKEKTESNNPCRDTGCIDGKRASKPIGDCPSSLVRTRVRSKAAVRRLSPALPVLRYFIANYSSSHEPSYTVITMRKLFRSET